MKREEGNTMAVLAEEVVRKMATGSAAADVFGAGREVLSLSRLLVFFLLNRYSLDMMRLS